MKGVPLPPEPIPAEAFGWVWSTWVALLRARATAEHRAQVATDPIARRAALEAVELVASDLDRFRRETASGFGLGLKFLAESDPAALYKACDTAIRDAAERMYLDDRDALLTRIKRLEADNERLRAELADLSRGVRVILREIGYDTGGER